MLRSHQRKPVEADPRLRKLKRPLRGFIPSLLVMIGFFRIGRAPDHGSEHCHPACYFA